MKTPINCTTAELFRVKAHYQNPKNPMEAFILHGVNAELKERELDNLIVRGLAPDPEKTHTQSIEFSKVLEG